MSCIRLLFCAVSIGLFFLQGCVAPKQQGSYQEAVQLAQFSSNSGDKALAKYFDSLDSSDNSGAFAKDPFKSNWNWATRSTFAAAERKAMSSSAYALFAKNYDLVWEDSYAKYMQSPMGKGRTLFKEKKYQEALHHFLGFAENNPDDWYVFNRLGWTYFNLFNYETAVDNFKRSLLHNDNIAWNYSGLGQSYYWLGEYDKAIKNIEHALALNKTKKNIKKNNFYLGMVYLALGKYPEALNIVGKKALLGLHTKNVSKGFLVTKIYKGAPAAMHGIELGDIISKLGDKQITLSSKFSDMFTSMDYGNTVAIVIERKGVVYTGNITLGIARDMSSNLSQQLVRQKRTVAPPAPVIVASTQLQNLQSEKSNISQGVDDPPIPSKRRQTAGPLFQQQWAVVIGISNYQYSGQGGLTDLIFADDDAKSFVRTLYNLGWNKSHIKLLTNKDATQRNIMIALESWLSKAGPNDQIILFWAGHGFPDPEDPEKVYFACYDTDISIPATGYRMDRVRSALEERRSKNVILLADTCHAGKLITRGKDSRGISIIPDIRKKNIPKGWVFMVGADTDRQSIEHSSWSNGAFTHSLLEGLNGEADGFQSIGMKDNIVTMGELRAYMNTAMPNETQKVLGVAKHPVITTSTGDPDIWNISLQVAQ